MIACPHLPRPDLVALAFEGFDNQPAGASPSRHRRPVGGSQRPGKGPHQQHSRVLVLGTAESTIHRWLNDGIIAGEQLTPEAKWRIRLTDDLRARVAEDAPDGYLTVYQPCVCWASRQTVWQRVKRGEIQAIHVKCGRKKGLRLDTIADAV